MTLQEEIPKYIPCTCDEIYKSRGLEAPDCPYHNYSDDIERLARLYAEAKCKEQREICRDEINNFGVDDLPEEYHETSDRMEAFVAEHAPAPKMD